MELEKLGRQLRLMIMLTQNRQLTIDEVSKRLGMSRRSIYRYLDAFKAMGFVVRKEGTRYRIDRSSPFLQEIATGIQFSEDEAQTISMVLNSVYSHSPQVRHLREKLSNLYDSAVLAKHGASSHVAHCISEIFRAIKEERVVLLKNYTSPSSGQTGDRIVEPYLFVNENSEVRCFELSSGMNKTFKLGRAEDVQLLDLLWSHKAEHKPFYSDLFHFTGEERHKVSLLLGPLSTSLLLEEFPDAERQLTPAPGGKHRLDTEVCDYKGVGRFVMGLSDDIEVINSPELVDYLKKQAESLTRKYSE